MPAPLEPRTLSLEPCRSAVPPCPHFGPCGGCQLQHLAYPAQLAAKAARLRTLLAATGLQLPELQLHASPPLAYRNRIRLTLAEVSGQLRAGYLTSAPPETSNLEPRTLNLAFLPIAQCPIAAPILWRATEALLAELNQRAGPWLKRAPFTLDQLELFTTANQSHLQIGLFVRTSAKTLPAKLAAAFNALCEALRAHIPQLAGAGIYLLPTRSARSRRAEQPRPGPTWGSPGLTYTVPTPEESIAAQDESVILSGANEVSGQLSGSPVNLFTGVKLAGWGGKNPRISSSPLPVPQLPTNNQQLTTVFWVPRTAFFQINRFLLPELVSLVSPDPVAANRAGQSAWDLYAGVGLFSRALAPHFTRVTAVEIAEPAFTALAQTKLPNLHAVKATTLDFLRTAVLQRDRPDRIVLDPPRTGAGPEVCALLARIAAPTLIYVSCSPETVPSDLHTLAASGYRVAQLHLLDLFPQTTHIETVAILPR